MSWRLEYHEPLDITADNPLEDIGQLLTVPIPLILGVYRVDVIAERYGWRCDRLNQRIDFGPFFWRQDVQ